MVKQTKEKKVDTYFSAKKQKCLKNMGWTSGEVIGWQNDVGHKDHDLTCQVMKQRRVKEEEERLKGQEEKNNQWTPFTRIKNNSFIHFHNLF